MIATDLLLIHGRSCITKYKDEVSSNIVQVNPNIHIYTIFDKAQYGCYSLLKDVKISNNNINYIVVDRYIKWITKIEESVNYIKSNYNNLPEFILYVDGNDVVLLNSIEKPEEILNYYDCKILFNGEANYSHTGHPPPGNPPISHHYYDKLYYDEHEKYKLLNISKFGFPLEFKGLNAGVFLGYKQDVLFVLEEAYQLMTGDYTRGFPYGCQDDQCILRYLHNKYYNFICVDVFNKFFLHCTDYSFSNNIDNQFNYRYYDKFKSKRHY